MILWLLSNTNFQVCEIRLELYGKANKCRCMEAGIRADEGNVIHEMSIKLPVVDLNPDLLNQSAHAKHNEAQGPLWSTVD